MLRKASLLRDGGHDILVHFDAQVVLLREQQQLVDEAQLPRTSGAPGQQRVVHIQPPGGLEQGHFIEALHAQLHSSMKFRTQVLILDYVLSSLNPPVQEDRFGAVTGPSVLNQRSERFMRSSLSATNLALINVLPTYPLFCVFLHKILLLYFTAMFA